MQERGSRNQSISSGDPGREGQRNAGPRLYQWKVSHWRTLVKRALPSTNGESDPFFDPDGQSAERLSLIPELTQPTDGGLQQVATGPRASRWGGSSRLFSTRNNIRVQQIHYEERSGTS